MLRLTKTELMLLVGALVLIIFGWQTINTPASTAEPAEWYAAIYATRLDGNELVASVPLSEGVERIIEVNGPRGITTVEVKGAGVHVVSSPCPDHTCIKFGWLYQEPDFAACLPNEVLVVVKKPADLSKGPFGSWND